MRIKCFSCNKPVTSEVPDETIFRAVATCPECVVSEDSCPEDCECFECVASREAAKDREFDEAAAMGAV